MSGKKKSHISTRGDVRGLSLRAGTAAPGCRTWISGSCVRLGFPSAPPFLPAAAGGAEGAGGGNKAGGVFTHASRHACFLLGELKSSHLLHTDLHAGFLRGSGGDLSVFVGLRGLHGESHHRSRDRRRGSVVVRHLNSKRSILTKTQDDTGCH